MLLERRWPVGTDQVKDETEELDDLEDAALDTDGL